jgi:hypothetical protein
MNLNNKPLAGIFTVLIVLMLATRYNHFGSSFSLPDASLAVFLTTGLLLARNKLYSTIAFIVLLSTAGGIDFYATQIQGVSAACITPAYWFLIPTYATMWIAGHWLGLRKYNGPSSIALFAVVSWLAISIAFFISNTSFYLFSGNYTEMSALEYASRVQQYYAPYVSGSLIYLTITLIAYMLFSYSEKTLTEAAKS